MNRTAALLFWTYLVLYGAFVMVAAFAPKVMEARPLAGVNLAVWCGFGLIASAIVLAMLYGWTSRAKAPGAPQNGGRA